jgi:hypothetical protein
MHVAAAVLAASLAGSVNLVWIDPSGTAPYAYETARDEATASLREAGIEARWRRGAPSQVLRADEVAVVLLAGGAPQSQPHRRILGAAKKGEDAVAAVWIYVAAVKWTLGLERPRFPALTTTQRIALGRALGRVAAHETIHALLPRLPHAETGLMSEQFDRVSLLAPRLPVDARTRAALGELAVQRTVQGAAAALIYGDKLLEPGDLSTKAHLFGTSAPIHGREPRLSVPSERCLPTHTVRLGGSR